VTPPLLGRPLRFRFAGHRSERQTLWQEPLFLGGGEGSGRLAAVVAGAFYLRSGAVNLSCIGRIHSLLAKRQRNIAALHRTGDGCVAVRVGVCAGQLIAILFQDERWRAAVGVCLNGGAPGSAEVKQKIKFTSENVYHTDVILSIQFLP
jgi:hypothetical protein